MSEPLNETSDAGLVVAISRYNQDALAEAYRRHAGAVFGLAKRLLAEASLAEEVVQEVFLRLWNSPDKFDPGRGSLRSYLLAQCHGRSVDLLRSEKPDTVCHLLFSEHTRPSEAGFDVQLVFLPAAFQPQIAPSVTCATGHCFVQTVHSAGFLQPGSQPIGRSSSGTGQQVLGVAAESSSMLALHQT